MTGDRHAPWIWAALLGSMWLVLVLCTSWEPVVRDGWGNLYFHTWHRIDLTSLWGLVHDGWTGSNPRFGQVLTTLLYTPGPYHVIFTPLLELALFWVMTTVILGRAPSLRRADDALVLATAVAMLALCTPQFGLMLFYRPYTGNYTLGLLLNLLWLVPYRLHAEAARPRAWWWAPLMLVLGGAAGLCNEHTGPAFLAAGGLAVAWSVRRGERIRGWMIAGLLGLGVGYVALLLAPGQNVRYGGIAQQVGLLQRVLDRGLFANVKLVTILGQFLAWSLPWIALAALARRSQRPAPASQLQRLALWGLAAAGVLATLTLLGSPKLGPRLYLCSVALISMAITGGVVAQLAAPWARKVCAAMSAAVLLYVAGNCLVIYHDVGAIGAVRLARIQHGPPGATVTIPRFHRSASKWFVGDEFTSNDQLVGLATDYRLGKLELAP